MTPRPTTLPDFDLPRVTGEDDGEAPPRTRFSTGWQDGWEGRPCYFDDIQYERGHADGAGCRRRKQEIDRAPVRGAYSRRMR